MPQLEFINSSCLSKLYESPFHSYPPEWNLNNFLILRLNGSDFTRENFVSFKDLRDDSAAGIILKCLASITEIKTLGTSYRQDNHVIPHLCGEGVPKTVQVLEATVNESGAVNGYYVWIFVNDEKFDFGEGFKRLFKLKRSQKNQNITSATELAWILERYVRKQIPLDSAQGEADISNPECPLNPLNVLTMENALALVPSDTIEDQRSASTYFDDDDGITRDSFNRVFPLPEKTFKIVGSPHFTLSYASSGPLPNYLEAQISGYRRRIEGVNDDSEEIRRQMEDLTISESQRNVLADRLTENAVTLEANYREMNEVSREVAKNKEILDDTSLLLSDDAVRKKLETRNDFMRLNREAGPELNKIKNNLMPGTEEYRKAMQGFRLKQLEKFTEVFNNSTNLTDATKSVRKFLNGLDPKDCWFENNQFTKSLSPFGNMVTRSLVEFDKVFKVETNFRLFFLLMLVKYCSYRFSYDLRPNLFMTGPGSAGKSFLMDLAEHLSAPGTVLTMTHQTTQAFNTDNDLSDFMLIVHEVNNTMLGVDPHGKEIEACPFFKARLAKQVTTVIHPQTDGKQRKAAVSCARVMGTTVLASNAIPPSDRNPMMQRLIRWYMTRQERLDLDKSDIVFGDSKFEDDALARQITHRFHLIDAYIFTVEKAIESGALPDPDTGVAVYVIRAIFDKLIKKGVPYPERRHKKMFVDLCRIMTIYYAIEMEFFSENGLRYHGKDRFNNRYLENLVKWFSCTEEIAVFVFTLMEQIWIPSLKVEIAKAAAFHLNGCVSTNTNEWIPYKDGGTNFRVERKADQYRGIEERVDLNYIELRGTNLKEIASHISAHLPSAPSVTDIQHTLYAMKNEYIDTYPKVFMPTEFVNRDTEEVESGHEFANATYENPIKIPSAILDSPPGENSVKRVSIAVDLINQDFSKMLKDIIPKALEHINDGERVLITGLPCIREVESAFVKKSEKYINIFDTIKLKRGSRTKIIKNSYSLTLPEMVTLYNRVPAQYTGGIGKISKHGGYILDQSIDWIHLSSYWLKQGIDPADGIFANPPMTKDQLWKFREDPRYNMINKFGLVDNYPEDFISKFQEKQLGFKNLIKDVEEFDETGDRSLLDGKPRYSDFMCPDESHHDSGDEDDCFFDEADASTGKRPRRSSDDATTGRGPCYPLDNRQKRIKLDEAFENRRIIPMEEEQDGNDISGICNPIF